MDRKQGSGDGPMPDRGEESKAYSRASGEMRRPLLDDPWRKHLTAAYPLTKSDSWRREDDQIPS